MTDLPGAHLTAGRYRYEQEIEMSTPLVPTEVIPAGGKPVERKVTFATAGTYIGGLALTAIVQSLQDGSLIAALPPVASAILAPLVPALLTLVLGYMTSNKVSADDAKAFAHAVEQRALELVQGRVDDAIDRAFAERAQ